MTSKIQPLQSCRISGSHNLISVLSLGDQALTGILPREKDGKVTSGPLELVWCPDSGLLQLRHSYDLGELYGMNYGYRSGLNASMVKHLQQKVYLLQRLGPVTDGDIVLDNGSNDATLLSSYHTQGHRAGDGAADPGTCRRANNCTANRTGALTTAGDEWRAAGCSGVGV